MDMIPRNDYGERCQFDAYCKLVLYHEAIDYLREMQRRRDRELSFSDLPQMEMDKLCVVDHYPSDRFTFSSHGYFINSFSLFSLACAVSRRKFSPVKRIGAHISKRRS